MSFGFAAGYGGDRGVRSWRERIRILEEAGVIKVRKMGVKRYAYVLLVHPSMFVRELREKGLVEADWYEMYRHRQLETGEIPLAAEVTPAGMPF